MAKTSRTTGKATGKKTGATKRIEAGTEAAATKEPTKKTGPKSANGNPYRQGSHYAICFDCLAKMGKAKPVSRKALLEAYCKASGKDDMHGRYDLAVCLSPTKQGEGHRSSRKEAYWVERLENGMVRLHMAG